jgi:hypothetical protein
MVNTPASEPGPMCCLAESYSLSQLKYEPLTTAL